MEKTIAGSSVKKRIIITAICFLLLQAAFTADRTKTDSHRWYYFSKDSFIETDLPQNSPETLFKPWTETVRISAASVTNETGFLLVNRLGMIKCSPISKSSDSFTPILSPDIKIFTGTTADALLTYNGYPVFHVYRNTLFNEQLNIEQLNKTEQKITAQNKNDAIPFLVQFVPDSGIFYPLLFTSSISENDASETSGVFFDGETWSCTVKTIAENNIGQDYLSFSSVQPLAVSSSKQQKATLQITEISAANYRQKAMPVDYADAPKRLTNLLSAIPDTFPFYIICSLPDSPSPLQFIRQNDTGEPMQAYAFLGDIFSIAIFSDGTTYFSGSLPDRYVLNGGALTAFRLPKLPEGYSYGAFTITNSKLYIAWEESDFYKTGRAGFLVVDLDKVLY